MFGEFVINFGFIFYMRLFFILFFFSNIFYCILLKYWFMIDWGKENWFFIKDGFL